MADEFTLIRQQLSGDIHRPRYHFLPPSNWMNDPNGLIHWKGQYHLFYQYNPFGALWGNMHWGHAVSPDLIHWTDLPIALAPTPNSPDETGVFSGCAVDHDGVPTLVYTGTAAPGNETQTQCLAVSRDDLLTWEKHPGNPILRDVPRESGQTKDFRDPFVWREDDAWYMVIGSRIHDVGGVIFLYRSHNLIDWDYMHPLLTGDLKIDGVMWECPNFFPLGDTWVLVISCYGEVGTPHVIYFVGTYKNHQFTPLSRGMLDYGRLYAPLSFVDAQQRRILVGWLRESRADAEIVKAGWAGVQSIPRVLSLDAGNRLVMTPALELEAIRGTHHHIGPMHLTQAIPLDVSGLALDIAAAFEVGSDGECGLRIACSPDAQARTDILYDATAQHLTVSRVTATGVTQIMQAPHPLAPGETLQLRILLDGSVVEIIANGRTSLTDRVYVTQADHSHVQVVGTGARLQALDLWEMPFIWQEGRA